MLLIKFCYGNNTDSRPLGYVNNFISIIFWLKVELVGFEPAFCTIPST